MKHLFLLDPSIIFLNHGSFGACPKEVFETYQYWQLEMERNPVDFLARRSASLLMESRSVLAEYIGTTPENLIYLSNTTSGVNTVARSLRFREGNEILTSNHEYGACDNAWEFIARQQKVRIVRVNIPLPYRSGEFVDRIWKAVTARTRLIYLSHITSTTALIFPIEEICRRARMTGILTCIDGAHAPGQIPLAMERLEADFYIGNCHKWLCSPKGSAFLYARPEHHHLLDALVVGWGYSEAVTGHTGFEAYVGSTLFERRMQWQGTRDLAAFLSVPAAIQFLKRYQWGVRITECHKLARQTACRITERMGLEAICYDDDYVQMVAIPVQPFSADLLKKELFEIYRIEVPVTWHENQLFIRISVQAYNTQQDLDTLIDAVQKIYRT